MRKTKWISAGLCGLMSSGLLMPQAVFAESSQEVYRLYNQNTGEHFYTKSADEKNHLMGVGWIYEGIGWYSADNGDAVYRVYNPNAKGGDHYYTTNQEEATNLVKLGWKWDNDGKAVFHSKGDVNLYVAYNPNADSGAHNYTTNDAEQKNLLNVGWKYGEVAWKVMDYGRQEADPRYDIYSKLGEMFFSSGAGAWGTSLKIQPDGSFTGSYHDSNMGDTGPGYPKGSLYYCNFSGKFGLPKKVNDYTWRAPMLELHLEEAPNQSKIVDGQLRITATPYGLEKCKNISIYLPGAPLDKLPSEVKGWVFGLNDKTHLPSGRYVLFNEEEKLAFQK